MSWFNRPSWLFRREPSSEPIYGIQQDYASRINGILFGAVALTAAYISGGLNAQNKSESLMNEFSTRVIHIMGRSSALDEFRESEREVAVLAEQNKLLVKRTEELESSASGSKSRMSDLESQIGHLQRMIATNEQTIISNNRTINDQKTQIKQGEELVKRYEKGSSQATKLTREVKKLRAQRDSLKRERSRLEREITQYLNRHSNIIPRYYDQKAPLPPSVTHTPFHPQILKIPSEKYLEKDRSFSSYSKIQKLIEAVNPSISAQGLEIHTRKVKSGRIKVWVSHDGEISNSFYTDTKRYWARLTEDGLRQWALAKKPYFDTLPLMKKVASEHQMSLRKQDAEAMEGVLHLKVNESSHPGKIRLLLKNPKWNNIDRTVSLKEASESYLGKVIGEMRIKSKMK